MKADALSLATNSLLNKSFMKDHMMTLYKGIADVQYTKMFNVQHIVMFQKLNKK